MLSKISLKVLVIIYWSRDTNAVFWLVCSPDNLLFGQDRWLLWVSWILQCLLSMFQWRNICTLLPK